MFNEDLENLLDDEESLSEIDELLIDGIQYMKNMLDDLTFAIKTKNDTDRKAALSIISNIGNDIIFNPAFIDPDSIDPFELDATIRDMRSIIKKFQTESGDIADIIVKPTLPPPENPDKDKKPRLL